MNVVAFPRRRNKKRLPHSPRPRLPKRAARVDRELPPDGGPGLRKLGPQRVVAALSESLAKLLDRF